MDERESSLRLMPENFSFLHLIVATCPNLVRTSPVGLLSFLCVEAAVYNERPSVLRGETYISFHKVVLGISYWSAKAHRTCNHSLKN